MQPNNPQIVQNRYDFILLFDVKDGNPNGDPDGGNLPRVDPETGEGLVTDVCIKRKVRNYIQMATHQGIFVRENSVLNDAINAAVEETTGKDAKTKNAADRDKARALMCQKYYDIRAFGAVLSTGNNAGQVRGPIQLTFGRSIDPIFPHEHTITRMAATDAKEQKANEDADDKGGNRTMGRKATV
ncbi:MAG: type I-C CRISPR-associated protein Cas7/Csd2, partial [Bacteroidales bacterium]|nr:type I-C CRISPR-associated protein Cas7/Csd2 [Bacteroidales bacterium]